MHKVSPKMKTNKPQKIYLGHLTLMEDGGGVALQGTSFSLQRNPSAILPSHGTPEGLNLQVYILTPKVASR